MARQDSVGVAPAAEVSEVGKEFDGPLTAIQIFSRVQVSAVLLIGVLSSLVVVLQPLLLGPLVAQGRLTLQEMGRTAMVEMLGMAVAIAICGAFLKPRRLRRVIILAVTVSVLANCATIISWHEAILAARLINGLSVGVLLWVWTGLLSRVELPARPAAIFLALQSAGALALSGLFKTVVIPSIGAAGGYACLAVASAVAGLLAFGAPSEYRGQGAAYRNRVQVPSGRGLLGLVAVALPQAGFMAFWVYVLPVGRDMRLSGSLVSFAVSAALAAQIAGGLGAAVLARINAKVALYASYAASIFALLVVSIGFGNVMFVIGVATLGLLWMFWASYQMPYLLEVDPSHRAAIYMITAQLLGLSAGPALASFVVSSGNVVPAISLSVGLFGAAALLTFVTTNPWMSRRRP